jgi:hypothetical protein
MHRRVRIVFGAIVVGALLFGTGVVLEHSATSLGEGILGTLALLAKLAGVAGPVAVALWHGIAASGRWRWATALCSTMALFAFGRWLQGLFGLDPPYIYFCLGLTLQIEAVAMGVAATVSLTASAIFRALGHKGN